MSRTDRTRRLASVRERGQALVEFSLAIIIFMVMAMGIFDFGRAIYMYNGVSQAAREIARVTSVHPGSSLGNSAETTAVVKTQKKLVPSLGNPVFACRLIDGTSVANANCKALTATDRKWVKVTITAPYSPVTPLLSLTGTWPMSGSSTIEISNFN